MSKAADGAPWALKTLSAAIQTFDQLNEELSTHADEQLTAAEIDVELSEEEQLEVLASLRRWSEDLSAGPPEGEDD